MTCIAGRLDECAGGHDQFGRLTSSAESQENMVDISSFPGTTLHKENFISNTHFNSVKRHENYQERPANPQLDKLVLKIR